MKLRWSVRLTGLAAVLLLLLALGGAGSTVVVAQGFDPASTIGAYTAALNNHDVQAALALFDKNGSATDASGRTFEGRDGLTEFLLDSGFGNPDARITTNHLRVVGNRALWSYTCSCADGQTDVRVVVNQDKITVFFVSGQGGVPTAVGRLAARSDTGLLPTGLLRVVPLLIGLGLGLVLAVVVLGLRRRGTSARLPARASQGNLLAGLARSRGLAEPRASVPGAAVSRGSSPWR